MHLACTNGVATVATRVKLHTLCVDTHLCMAILIFYTIHLSAQFNHFTYAHCVVRCEVNKASEATDAVAEASKATVST